MCPAWPARPASAAPASAATSAARRNVNASRTVIDRSAHRPASRNALTIVRLDSWMPTVVPVRFGRDLPDRGGEALQRRVVVGVALGKDFDARAAVRRHPVALEVGGQGLQRDRFGLQRGAQLVERDEQARGSAPRARARAPRDRRRRESSAPSRGAPHPIAAAPAGCGPAACSSACAVRSIARTVSCVGGRRLHVQRIERGVEQHRGVGRAARAWLPAVRE